MKATIRVRKSPLAGTTLRGDPHDWSAAARLETGVSSVPTRIAPSLALGVECLEDRVLLAGRPTAYTVNLTSATGQGDGNSGDLVYVVTQANKNSNPAGSLITFDPAVFASGKMLPGSR